MSVGGDNPNVETGPWNPSWIAAFPAGVAVCREGQGTLTLHAGDVRFRLRSEPPLCDLLCRLEPLGLSVGDLVRAAQDLHVSNAVSCLFHHLANLLAEGFLSVAVRNGGEAVATLVAVASGFRLPPRTEGTGKWVLSRFASLRRGTEGMVAESPRSSALVTLQSPQSLLCVQSFAVPQSEGSAAGAVPGVPLAATSALFDLLHAAELLTPIDDTDVSAEDSDPELFCWEPHELLFHSRSRRVRFDEPYGAMFAVADRVSQPPAVKPAHGTVLPLPRPDLQAIERVDPSLTQALEQRQSIREYGDVPPSVDQLGEFLYRVARIRERRVVELETGNGPVAMEITSRPYPAGGSLHELEIYPVIQQCRGLAPGLYRYEPASHGLETISPPSAGTQALLQDAGQAAGVPVDEIQLAFVIAARFPRIAWKYSAFAYSLVLKHVGVLFQTMYLVATAMKLSPCALGAGNSDRFAKLLSDNPYAETSVGEFLLGSRA
ncbi:MAG: SagB family peptide dehydrogenase [Planctomycetaceae bacterium]|nr:SagB family peptide dehydrogenase [Planctomycetaceae bacterium]